MSNLIDRIRKKLGASSFVSAPRIRERCADNPELAGYTFKSFDEVAPHKTAADFNDYGDPTMFANAQPGMPQYTDEQSEADIQKAMDVTPETYGLNPQDFPPRDEWIEKREQKEERRQEKEQKKLEQQQKKEEAALQKQQLEQQKMQQEAMQ